MSSIRPQLFDNLLISLMNVMTSCHPFLNEEECDNKLKPVVRRILLQKALGERSLLAISGTQGAGKTTLIKNLYGLNDEDAKWFETNEGRGEKHPILITEHAGKDIEGVIKVFARGGDGKRVLRDKNLRKEFKTVEEAQAEFRRAAADRDNSAGEVLLELRLPAKLGLGKDRGWVLLPGYEKSDHESQSWQDTMSAVAANAYGAIVVTDKQRLAGDQQSLVRDTNMNRLDGMQPVVVVSKTDRDAPTEEAQQELREEAAKKFDVEIERVVCSGSKDDDPDYMANWQKKFKAAAENFIGGEGRGSGNARSLALAELINGDLRVALAAIKQDVSDRILTDEHDVPVVKWIEQLMETFDEAEEDFRHQYERAIRKTIDSNTAGVQRTVLETLRDKHEGPVRGVLNFFKSDTKQLLKLQDLVKDSVGKSEDIGSEISRAVLGRTQRVLGRSAQGNGTGILPYEKEDASKGEGTASAALVTLYKSDDEEVGRIEGLEKAVEALPALAINYAMNLSQFDPLQKEIKDQSGSWHGENSVSTINIMQHFSDNLGDATEQATKAHGILQSFGKNLLGAGIGTAGAEIAGSVLSGGPLILAAGGIFAAGYLGVSLVQEAKTTDRANRTTALEMLESFKQNRFELYMESYADAMEITRANFRSQLQKRYKISEKLGKKDRAFRSLAIAQDLREQLHEELETNLHAA